MDETTGEDSIAADVGTQLRERGESLAVAESVTGGLVSSRLTAVPGASDYLDRAWIVYDYDAWRTAVGVSRETLDQYGAVSEPAARELAARARDLADVTWGLSTTGIAGPTGGSSETPVGTAFVGVAHAAPWESGESFVTVDRYEFAGDRTTVREHVAGAALETLVQTMESQ